MRVLVVTALVLVAAIALIWGLFLRSDDGGATAVGPGVEQTAPVTRRDPEILAPKENVRTAEAPAEVEAEEPGVSNPMLGNRLVGTVYDDAGKPLPNAEVKLSRDPFSGEALSMQWFLGKKPTGQFERVVTNAQGVYTFVGIEPASDYFLYVDHDRFRPSQEDLVFVGEEGEFGGPDVHMVPGASLSVYVTDVGNNAVPDAHLYLDSAYMMGEEQDSPDRMVGVSDETGFFEFKNVGPGARNLSVLADGYGMTVQHNLQFDGSPGEKLEHTFVLEPGQPIAGRVFGPEDEPVVGAKIMAMKYSNQTSSRGDAVTNENGEFIINDLAQGSFNLSVQADGYRVARHNRVQVGDVNVLVEMIKLACVGGRVTDSNGQPLTNFTVVALRASPQNVRGGDTGPPIYENTEVKAKVDESSDGTYELCGLNPGTFVLKVRSKGLAPRLSEPFQITEGAPLPNVAVRLSEGGTIKGRLVDDEGAPVAGARLSTHDDEHGTNLDPFLGGLVDTSTTLRKGKTDAEGYFELNLLNEGRYRLEIEHPRFSKEMLTAIVVVEGGTADLGTIKIKSGGVVQGTVRDSSGGLVARGFVRLFRTDQDETFSYQVRTDADGNYSIPHVKAGSYKLSATRNSSSGGGDAFEAILDQQSSEVLVNVLDGKTLTRELRLGN